MCWLPGPLLYLPDWETFGILSMDGQVGENSAMDRVRRARFQERQSVLSGYDPPPGERPYDPVI